MTLFDLILHMREVSYCEKMSEKSAHVRTRILTNSDRKRDRKNVVANYNKTRFNTDHQHDRWMELKEELRVQIHAEV